MTQRRQDRAMGVDDDKMLVALPLERWSRPRQQRIERRWRHQLKVVG